MPSKHFMGEASEEFVVSSEQGAGHEEAKQTLHFLYEGGCLLGRWGDGTVLLLLDSEATDYQLPSACSFGSTCTQGLRGTVWLTYWEGEQSPLLFIFHTTLPPKS